MTYKGDARGALWRRWDLHVHTPASYVHEYGDRGNPNTWDQYFASIASLPIEVGVLGINDYFSIDGYRRVLAEWEKGRFPNILKVFPVVELRLDHLAGNATTQRVNYHVLFSDDVNPDEIEREFLYRLHASVENFTGCIGHSEGMGKYGSAVRASMPAAQTGGGSDVVIGFQHAYVQLEEVTAALSKSSSFRGRTLTAIGFSEFASMRWAGGGGVVKRELAASVNFLLGNSETPSDHERHAVKLREEGVSTILLDASDAHRFSDDAHVDRRMGKTMTWLKADPTFEGLRRSLQRPLERIHVGVEPPQLGRIATHRSRFIDQVSIRKNADSTTPEVWFDNSLLLNPGLVAVIGNQGSGKSALTDSLALAANSEVPHFSFLTIERFRSPKSGKASQFHVEITWMDGDSFQRGLDQDRMTDRPERARYVPQHFFETATNEIEVDGSGTLYDEIEKAVFSHIPVAQRQGCLRFRDLVAARTHGMNETLAMLRGQLTEINQEIVSAEAETALSARNALAGRIEQRRKEIAALEGSPPKKARKPNKSKIEPKVDALRIQIKKLSVEVESAQKEETNAFTSRQALQGFVDTVRRVTKKTHQTIEQAFDNLGADGDELKLGALFTIQTDLRSVESRIAALDLIVEAKRQLHNRDSVGSPAARLELAHEELSVISQTLGAADRAYDSYLNAHAEWEGRLRKLKDAGEDPDALSALLREKDRIEIAVPEHLTQLRLKRASLCDQIHQTLATKLGTYRELAEHVKAFLRAEELTRDHYELEFDLALVPTDLSTAFFDIVKFQGAFAGQDSAREWVRNRVSACDCDDLKSIRGAIADIESKAIGNDTQDHLRWESIASIVRSGHQISEIYDCLYGLSFLEPRYRLALQGQPLEQLSPGERGILLLIFYLIVDKSDLPLIIDQPEGNLNNQSIYERIVPVIKMAKERRQIIMVSHNPNIVVGCDADQIIHANIDASDGFRVTYLTGALEHPQFREFTVDKLEGTRPAFQERTDAYLR